MVVPGVVDLAYTENHDVAFDGLSRLSLHAPAAWLAAFALCITAAVLVAWVRRRRAAWPVHVGFACIVAGALGNALDRATRGHVVDFIHVHFWPVFNVADILVVAGIAILVMSRAIDRQRLVHLLARVGTTARGPTCGKVVRFSRVDFAGCALDGARVLRMPPAAVTRHGRWRALSR